jgi:hypothetical protein
MAAIFDLPVMSTSLSIRVCRVAGPQKYRENCWKSVAKNYSRCAMRCTCVSGITSAILISGWLSLNFNMMWRCQRQHWLRPYQKLSKQRSICSYRWNTLPDWRVTKYITFWLTSSTQYYLKTSSTHLRFRCWHLITGRTISRILTSFYSHWIALGMRERASKNSDGPLSYSTKT